MSKDLYVPLPELDQAQFNLPVPSFVRDQEQILVNPTRLQRLGFIGAFSEIRVTSYAGQEEQTGVGIAGLGDGTAFAAVATTTTKAEQKDGEYGTEDTTFAAEGKPLTIPLNSTDITRKVEKRAQQTKTPIRDPELWAQQIDAHIRKQAIASAWRNLTTPPTKRDARTDFAQSVLLSGVDILLLSTNMYETHLGQTILGVVFAASNMAPLSRVAKGTDWRSEAFRVMPLPVDRALLATAYGARPGSIVKTAKKV